MDLTIEQTILVNRIETERPNSVRDKVIMCICCLKPDPLTINTGTSTKQVKKRCYSKVRFREPSKVEPADVRQPSWESYRSWTSLELDDAVEEFINATLTAVRKTLAVQQETEFKDVETLA